MTRRGQITLTVSTMIILSLGTLIYPALGSAMGTDFWKLPIPQQGEPPDGLLWPGASLSPSDCALCHPKQYQEWAGSLHAGAASPGLLGQLEAFDDEIQGMCLNCHAPRAEQQALLKEQRSEVQTDGVDCASCHLRFHQRYGPRDTPLTPHGPVLAESLFWSSDFCAPCHQFEPDDVAVNGKLLENTVKEWMSSAYARQDVSCQDCHMQDGSHHFRGIHDPDTLRQGLAFMVERTADGIIATVSNQGAGHALPTYITPRIRVVLENRARSASSVAIIQRAMSWDEDTGWQELFDTRLLPGGSRRVHLPLQAQDHATASVIVEPDADYYERVYPFLIEQLEGDISTAALRQLKAAHATAATSTYTAYTIQCGSAEKEDYRCE